MMFLLVVLALPMLTIAQDTTMTLYSTTNTAGAELACNSKGQVNVRGTGWRNGKDIYQNHDLKHFV